MTESLSVASSNNDGATFRTADTRVRARPRSCDTTKMVLSSCLCPSDPLCFLLCHPLCSLCVSLCLPPLGGACPQTTAACFTALPTRAMEFSPTRRAAGLASLRLRSAGTASSVQKHPARRDFAVMWTYAAERRLHRVSTVISVAIAARLRKAPLTMRVAVAARPGSRRQHPRSMLVLLLTMG